MWVIHNYVGFLGFLAFYEIYLGASWLTTATGVGEGSEAVEGTL